MKLSPVAELSSKDRRILLNTCYGHFMSHFNMLVFPALVLPLTARLGLGMAQVLELSFWMYLLFGLTALFWGVVADRFGAKFVMTFGVGALAVMMVAAIESNYDVKTIFYLLALLAAAALVFIGWLIARSRKLIDTHVMDGVDMRVRSAKL